MWISFAFSFSAQEKSSRKHPTPAKFSLSLCSGAKSHAAKEGITEFCQPTGKSIRSESPQTLLISSAKSRITTCNGRACFPAGWSPFLPQIFTESPWLIKSFPEFRASRALLQRSFYCIRELSLPSLMFWCYTRWDLVFFPAVCHSHIDPKASVLNCSSDKGCPKTKMQLHLKWKSDKVTKLRSNDGLFLNAKTFLEYKNIIAMKKKKKTQKLDLEYSAWWTRSTAKGSYKSVKDAGRMLFTVPCVCYVCSFSYLWHVIKIPTQTE